MQTREQGPSRSALIVEPDQQFGRLLGAELSRRGFNVTYGADTGEALAVLEERRFALVFVALCLSDADGLEFIRQGAALFRRSHFVLLGGNQSGTVVEAVRCGAFDVLARPLKLPELENLIERVTVREEPGEVVLSLTQSVGFETIVTASSAMQCAIAEARKVAHFKTPLLLLGESGTGKELFARAVHASSPRSNKALVTINCANLPESLLESQLFGHVRGSFTGADRSAPGIVGEAEGGTLFLDEIGELGFGLQAKLLRFIQDAEYRPIGAARSQYADVRFIAATNVDLRAAVERGTFRADLYYRLAIFPIELPPLRERREDITLLATYFLARFAANMGADVPSLKPSAAQLLREYGWPGNVRQLANVLERSTILYRGHHLEAEHLRPMLRGTDDHRPKTSAEAPHEADSSPQRSERWQLPPEGLDFEQLEESLLRQALERANGNLTKASRLLGLSRAAFRYRISKLLPAEAKVAVAAELNAGEHTTASRKVRRSFRVYESTHRRIS